MIVEFLPEAKSELFDSVEYYEGELSGLSQRLWDEVDQHITWIAGNYEVPRLRPGGYRRVNLKIFPYYISYVVSIIFAATTRTRKKRVSAHPDMGIDHRIDLLSLPFLVITHVRIAAEWDTRRRSNIWRVWPI
jgi:hypothetical protein